MYKKDLLDSIIKLRDLYRTDQQAETFLNAFMTSVLFEEKGNPTCCEFVKQYIENERLKIDGTLIFNSQGDPILDPGALFYKIYETYKQFCDIEGIKHKKFTERNIASEFSLIAELQWGEKKETIRKVLCLTSDKALYFKKLKELCRLLCGNMYSDDSIEFRRSQAFIAHWMWQVLTKVFYGPAIAHKFGHESMLILYSPEQKTGKSTFSKWFLKPFLDTSFVWKADFSRLEDKFSTNNMGLNYIAFFDEMARASAANMCKVKQLITEEEVHFRGMFTQNEMKLPKTTTFFGTTNVSVRSLFNDTSGLRRFHEIQVQGKAFGKINLSALETWDFTEFFRIFPLNPDKSPIFDIITEEELDEYEETMRPKHVVELWLEDQNINIQVADQEKDDTKLISYIDIYNRFQSWALKHGFKHPYIPNSESFNKKMEELGAHKGRTTRDNRTYRGFYVQM